MANTDLQARYVNAEHMTARHYINTKHIDAQE